MSETLIHRTAIVAEGAELDEGVIIDPYAVIGPDVRIGSGSVVGSHAVVEGHTTLGRDNRIFSHAVIGSPPQDKKFQGEKVYLTIGDENVFREFVTINPGTEGGGSETVIGNQNLLMAYVHVAHDCRIGDGCILSNGAQLAGHVELENDVIIGGMSGVHQFARVGTGAMLGGGSMLAKDLPPYCLATGNRATLRGLNSVGLKRNDVAPDDLATLKEVYRVLFRQGTPLNKALQTVRSQHTDHALVATMLHFIDASDRGVARPERNGNNNGNGG